MAEVPKGVRVDPPYSIPRSMVHMLLGQVDKKPSARAAQFKVGDTWKEATWKQMVDRVRLWSEGLAALGVKPSDRVGVLSSTRYEYALADGAILGAAAIAVPIYHSNTPAEVQYVASDSGMEVVFVENAAQLAKFRESKGRLPKLRMVVLFEGQPPASDAGWVTTMEAFEKKAAEEAARDPGAFDRRVAAIDPEQPACFIYTSGTTGNPKGVVLTHKNWCYEAAAVERVELIRDDDSILLFLPLAHSFAKVVEAAWWHLGATMAFAEAPEKVVPYCGEIHPSLLPAVPRIFEKVFSTVVASGSAEPGIKGVLFRWAMSQFENYVSAREAGKPYSNLSWTLAKALVFSKVEHRLRFERLGGRIRTFVSGGAPLSRKIAYFFELLHFEVLEGYGLTETSAASCVNPPGRAKIGTVGPAMPGTELRIAQDGEILMRGPGVMAGYYNLPQATAECIEPDGWFHTGDIGEIDSDGYLRITDRKKDIIVTAGGKNVAPQNLENALKTEPIISQVMVHGDRRKYLTALVTVQEEYIRNLATKQGIGASSYGELSQRPEVRAEVQAAIDRLNGTLPSYETIKQFRVLDRDFSQETGEMTPTLKVKRKFTSQKYQAILDGMYDEKLD